MTTNANHRAEYERLVALVSALRKLNDQFNAIGDASDDEANNRKRQLRGDRANTVLQINVVLARLGEVDRATMLERAPFERKIQNLDSYLSELASNLS